MNVVNKASHLTAGVSGALPREATDETDKVLRAKNALETERGEASAAHGVGRCMNARHIA